VSDDEKQEPDPKQQPSPEPKPKVEPVTMLPDMGHVEKRTRNPADATFERH
jgi:hypothetical protein